MMKYKYPIEYELTPKEVDQGIHWLTFKMKNIGTKTLTGLDVQLHSLDTYQLKVNDIGNHVAMLKPDEEIHRVFRVAVNGSADVYASISACKDGDLFWWESGWMDVNLSENKAKLERLLVLSHPYTLIGKTLEAEATIKGISKNSGLKLEFWVNTPSGKLEEMAKIDTKDLSAGEEVQYSAEFTPKETGYYTINAYLYDGWKRLGHKTISFYTRKP